MLVGEAQAKIVLPAIFADNMVLQQNEKVALWGWADAGEKVTIKPSWSKEITTVAAADGKWTASLKTLKAGGPYSVKFSGKDNTLELANILFGEVWLCSGQSNMNFPLQKLGGWRTGVINYEQEVAAANHPNIRFFTVEQKVADTPQKDCKGTWEVCSPKTAVNFSAVAYYFAKDIEEQLHVPVGIIHSSWGGTPVEAWTKKEILESDEDFRPILERFKKQSENPKEATDAYKLAVEQWKKDVADGKLTGIAKVQGPREVLTKTSNKAPSNLYNAMIAPLVPFAIKGALWYQGESNMERAYQYRKLFPAMVSSWRKDWHAEFPFYFVQIAPHKAQHAEIREAQLLSSQSLKKAGMVVTTDVGDSADIHPRNKEAVGKRLALWALAKTYNKHLAYSGPLYKSIKIEDGKAFISFDFAEGLAAKNGSLKEFTIAGADQVFHPAKAEIKGNKVLVWSDEVSAPVAVRFGWKYVPHAELFNQSGLPASPFRTDSWKGETDNNR